MKLRILLIGADSDYAIERFYIKYFSEYPSFQDVKFYPAQNVFLAFYNKNIFNKIIYRLGLSDILVRINREIFEIVSEFNPDVIVFFKGMEIFPSTLDKLRSMNVRLVNYNPDNPFIFSSRGSGNRNVAASIRKFDLYLSYDRQVCDRLIHDYGVRSALLPFGFELDDALYEKISSEKEILKACFVGNCDKNRLDLLNNLAGRGVFIDLYGFGWKKNKLHGNIVLHDYLSDDLMWKNLRRYRVQLNILRVHNLNSHNMRTFEIPASGGIQLAPATPDHSSFFEVNKEIFLYTDLHSCVNQIRFLLNLNVFEAEKIRKSARERSIKSCYSYKYRTGEMLRYINELF